MKPTKSKGYPSRYNEKDYSSLAVVITMGVLFLVSLAATTFAN